ncbi:MAG: hypothetical protein ABI390_06180 [Daejeonella sp.]
MSGIITYDILNSVISAPLAFAGILVGTTVGFARGRLTNIIWNDESGKVISRMDRLGILVLIIYLPFTIFKKWIFGYWIHGPVLTAFTFSFVAGALCGRIFSMRRKIRKLLKIQGILKSN